MLDIRTPEEFAAGHLPIAVHAPGGQLLQATDQWMAVRGARVVLVDDTEVRATVIAHWLGQMGWDTAVLQRRRACLVGTRRPSASSAPLADAAAGPADDRTRRSGEDACR